MPASIAEYLYQLLRFLSHSIPFSIASSIRENYHLTWCDPNGLSVCVRSFSPNSPFPAFVCLRQIYGTETIEVIHLPTNSRSAKDDRQFEEDRSRSGTAKTNFSVVAHETRRNLNGKQRCARIESAYVARIVHLMSYRCDVKVHRANRRREDEMKNKETNTHKIIFEENLFDAVGCTRRCPFAATVNIAVLSVASQMRNEISKMR